MVAGVGLRRRICVRASNIQAWVLPVLAIAFAAMVAGCASVYNLPGNAPLGQALADNNFGREVPNYEDEVLLALSFSGGGMRAAAFSFGVLTELDRSRAGSNQGKTLLDRVDFISGVSGGSVTAAYFGLKKRAALDDFKDACFIPEPTSGKMVRSQVGVIWFRLKVRGFPVHVFEAGSGSNAITAAYHLIQALEKLEAEWNERAKSDRHFKAVTHPINFNPGIIKGGDWASSVPAWCDVDCRIAILPSWSVADCQAEILACVSTAARDHRFLSNNPPEVEWSGFLSEGYELKDSAEPEAAFGKAYTAVYGGAVEDLVFTALTDTRFYGLNYNIPSLCFGASGAAMHGFNEYVDLDSLRKSTKATALFIAEWCGVEKI
jgi:acetylornithine deacetylase/succinyl-diaminopimelate desuccinylase-like protein